MIQTWLRIEIGNEVCSIVTLISMLSHVFGCVHLCSVRANVLLIRTLSVICAMHYYLMCNI